MSQDVATDHVAVSPEACFAVKRGHGILFIR